MSHHGLRGHETVIRLVGKRRKLTLSTISPAESVPGHVKKEDDGAPSGTSDVTTSKSTLHHEVAIELPKTIAVASALALKKTAQQDGSGSETQVTCISWVQCPICVKSIRGDVINSHLGGRETLVGLKILSTHLKDICLQGGVTDMNRKKKQLTMVDFGGQSSFLGPKGMTLKGKFAKTEFGKVEPGASVQPVTLCSEDRNICQTGMNEQLKGHRNRKLEGNAIFGSSQPVNIFGVCQRKVNLTLITGDDAQTDIGDSGGAKEQGTIDSTVLEKSEGVNIDNTEPGLDNAEYVMDERNISILGEAMSSCPVAGSDCVCHCHLSSSRHTEEKDDDAVFGEGKLENRIDSVDSPHVLEVQNDGFRDIQSTHEIIDDKVLGFLDTKIVGRRFNRGVVCKEGMEVSCLRDPDNPKDPNAIKIVRVDIPSGPILGHLSREISLHLCSLLDKGLLHLSGFVTALPEQNFGAVPIKLFYRSKISKEDFLSFEGADESLQNTLVAVENLNSPNRPPTARVSKYQQNFLFMLQVVLERDSHLFEDDEKRFLETFSSLSDDAQRLFIRLYQRKGPWFRVSAIEYWDVVDVSAAAEDLIAGGYMTLADREDEDSDVSLRKRFQILNVLELRQFICSSLLKKRGEVAAAKKDDLVNMAVSLGMQKYGKLVMERGTLGDSVIEMLAEITGRCIRLSDTAEFLVWRLQRLFFLNGETDLSAFLVVDMGLVKYPRYKCWRTRNIFITRGALLAYEQALEVAQGMDMALECNDTKTALELLKRAHSQMLHDDSNNAPVDRTPTFLARFSASYVYRNVCTLGVSILERERRYCEAVDILKQLLSTKTIKSGRWGYWTVRLSMDLDHLGKKEESLQIAEEGVNDPWIRGGDRVTLQRRVVRLGKPPRRWKKPPYAAALKRNFKEVQLPGRPLNCVTGVKSRFYGYDGQQCGVEELALQYYASEEGGGWQGVHSEGGVWMTLFGLLMWDVLFADVPDVFQTSFQTAPLDLDTEVFFSSRQCLIEARLEVIAQGNVSELLDQIWNGNFGTVCRGVNWERHSLEELQTIAACIGGSGLSAVCQLLAEDHAGWASGMPDLLLWRTQRCPDSINLAHDSRNFSCIKCGCNSARKDAHFQSTLEVDEIVTMNGEESTASSNRLKGVIQSPPASGSWRKQGVAKLVEVKGPRDRLSEQQTAWIWLLMNAGLTVEVCKVREELS